MEFPRYIAVEGPIGVGKTSLVQKLAETTGGRMVLEDPEANPYLSPFYKNRRQYALKTQILFLINRYLQQKELIQQDLFSERVVCDYLFSKDRIFASINLNDEELYLYERIYSLLDTNLPRPDLVIFLQASLEVLKKHIRRRGIDYERNIDDDYLAQVIEGYNRYFFSYQETPLLVVNVSDIDFVKSRADYENLTHEIALAKRGERHYVTLGR